MKLSYLLGALLLGAAQLASAAIYTYIDASGARAFTAQPPQQQAAKRLDLAPANQVPSTPVINPPPVYQEPLEARPVQYQLLRILLPEPNATTRANERTLIVTVYREPKLLEGHHYRLLLDGNTIGEPTRSPVFPLKELERGRHLVAVEIINAQGAVLERTPAQPFHLRQTTLNDRRRVNPCSTDDYGRRPECPLKDQPKK